MPETNDNGGPRLWTRMAGFSDETWTRADSVEKRAATDRLILPLGVFLSLDDADRESRAGCLAVELQPGEHLQPILPHLDALPLVVLAFPAFNDGRAYSKAALLRTRHGFAGALRASGDVLPDQLAHMLRTGFDELEVSHPVAIARLEAGRADAFDAHYQPAAGASHPAGRYAWRRIPA